MKSKKLFLFIGLVTLLTIFAGCNDEEEYDPLIWDFKCYNINIIVLDEEGNDLLDHNNPENILNNEITVVYNNNKYAKKYENEITLRALTPQKLAIRTIHDEKNNKHYIAFGEFSPTENFKSETFTIDWGDGTKDEIKFDLYITWKNPKEPTVHKKLYINEKEVETDESGFTVNLTKKPRGYGYTVFWDSPGFYINFIVTDKRGNDLINPDTKGHILNNTIIVTYKDQNYKHYRYDVIETRAMLLKDLAIRKFYVEKLKKYYISFGPFESFGNFENETFTIDWGDGTKDEIKFESNTTWESPINPIVHRKLYLNGKEVKAENDFVINLVKEAAS